MVRSGACCVGRLQSAWAIVGSSGGSRRVAPADCGLGLRSRGGGGVNAAADRHVTSWCEDRGARAKRLGGDSIRCTERLQPPEPVLQPLVLRACKKGKGAPSRDVQGRSISPNHFIDDLQCARRWRCLSVRAAPLPVQRTPPVAALTDRFALARRRYERPVRRLDGHRRTDGWAAALTCSHPNPPDDAPRASLCVAGPTLEGRHAASTMMASPEAQQQEQAKSGLGWNSHTHRSMVAKCPPWQGPVPPLAGLQLGVRASSGRCGAPGGKRPAT